MWNEGARYLFAVTVALVIVSCPALGADWTHTWGGAADDLASGIAIDTSGNIYLAGSTRSFGAGGSDVLILKYDNTGNLLWSRTWGGPGEDFGNAVAVDGAGNVYVAGATGSFGAGWFDALLLKFDSAGNLLWQRTWGGFSYEVAYSIAIDSSNNVYLAAESYSFGRAAVLLKFSPNGDLLLSRTWKGPATYDAAYSLDVDGNGNIYLAGISWDYSVFPNHNTILLLKYDSLGNLVWNRNWAGPGEDEAWGSKVIRADSAGNIYLAARTSSVGYSAFDALVLKFDSNGNLTWSRKWGGSGYDTGSGLAFDASGNLVLSGQTKSFLGGASSALLLKYDTNGNHLASKIWGGNGDAVISSVVVDSRDNVVVAGFTPNNGGTWRDVAGSAAIPTGSITSPSANTGLPPGYLGSPAGTVGTPSGVIDIGGGGPDLFVATISQGTVAERAAALAKTLLTGPYGYGGKGYDFNISSYMDRQAIFQGYWYERTDCADKNKVTLSFDKGVDCSGLVLWAYNTAAGATTEFRDNNPIQYPTADGQFWNNSETVTESDLKPGDLMFFDFDHDRRMDHVAMYVGGDDVVEAPDCGVPIRLSNKSVLETDSGFLACGPTRTEPCFRRVTKPMVGLTVRTHSPVSLAVTDPDGFAITGDTLIFTEREVLREVPGVLYYLEDTNLDDTVLAPTLKTGVYIIRVVLKPGVLPSDIYRLEVAARGNVLTLAENVPVVEIPTEGYAIQSIGGQITPLVPFVELTVHGEIERGGRGGFEVLGHFTLGSRSNAISPTTEDVTLRVGTFSTTIPAGSFNQNKKGQFKFEGIINGVNLEVEIVSLGDKHFGFKAEAENAGLVVTTNREIVTLTVGNDGGSTNFTPKFD